MRKQYYTDFYAPHKMELIYLCISETFYIFALQIFH